MALCLGRWVLLACGVSTFGCEDTEAVCVEACIAVAKRCETIEGAALEFSADGERCTERCARTPNHCARCFECIEGEQSCEIGCDRERYCNGCLLGLPEE